MSKSGRKPDYQLKILNKSNDKRGIIGAAWKNEDGSISIQINPCIILDGNQLDDFVITLFKNDFNPDKPTRGRKRKILEGDTEDEKEPF